MQKVSSKPPLTNLKLNFFQGKRRCCLREQVDQTIFKASFLSWYDAWGWNLQSAVCRADLWENRDGSGAPCHLFSQRQPDRTPAQQPHLPHQLQQHTPDSQHLPGRLRHQDRGNTSNISVYATSFLFMSDLLSQKASWENSHWSGNSLQENAHNHNSKEYSRFSWKLTISFPAYGFRAGLRQHLAKCAFLLCGQKKTNPHPPSGVPHPWSPGQGTRVQTQHSHGEGGLWWGGHHIKTLPTGRRAIREFHKSPQDFRDPGEFYPSTPRCRTLVTVGKRFFESRVKDRNALPDCAVQLQHRESRDGREQLHQVRNRGLCNVQPYYPTGVSNGWLLSCDFPEN